MVFLSQWYKNVLRSLRWYLGFGKMQHLEFRGKLRKCKSRGTLSIQNRIEILLTKRGIG